METIIKNIFGENAKIVKPLMGGMMNQSFLVENDNTLYVLYIPTEQANEMVNRPLEKENQSIVSELSITSKNVYFDTKSGIKANIYIPGSSLDKVNEWNYQKVADMLKTLHSSKKLSKENYSPFTRFIDTYEKEALSYIDKVDDTYKLLRDFLFKHKDYLESQKLVLSHNDFQRSNIIKTDNDEYYLIDFEFMGNNDEIYDIAAFGNGDVKEGRILLDHYFDFKPSKDEITRYYLWRIYISLQWYVVALTKHYRGEGKTHQMDFTLVAKHFLDNAFDAYQQLLNSK